jgi:hypothetical protein
MPELRFNKEAWDAFAKELRRASWGAAALAAALGIQASSGVAAVAGGVAWAVLQVLALVVQSIVANGGKR